MPSPTPKLILADGYFFFKATTEGAADTKSPTPPISPIKIDLGLWHRWGIPSHFFRATGIIV